MVIQKLLQKHGAQELTFDRIKELYRSEAQAFDGAKLSKQDISEDTLRRILVELVSSGVAAQGSNDVYSLKIGLIAPDLAAEAQRRMFLENDRLTEEALKFLRVNPFRYSVQETAAHLAQVSSADAGRSELFLIASVRQGSIVVDNAGKLAMATESFSPALAR